MRSAGPAFDYQSSSSSQSGFPTHTSGLTMLAHAIMTTWKRICKAPGTKLAQSKPSIGLPSLLLLPRTADPRLKDIDIYTECCLQGVARLSEK